MEMTSEERREMMSQLRLNAEVAWSGVTYNAEQMQKMAAKKYRALTPGQIKRAEFYVSALQGSLEQFLDCVKDVDALSHVEREG